MPNGCRKKIIWKFCSLVTAVIFACTNTVSAQTLAESNQTLSESPHSVTIPARLNIPEEFGTLETEFRGKAGSPFVFYIQDAHAIIDAQNHIQELIQYLQKEYRVKTVALEGASGKMDTTLLRAFPEEKTRQKILQGYLERGELTGAELAAISGPDQAEFYGIEDWELFEENYLAYLRAVQTKEKVLAKIKKVKDVLDEERKKVFSLEMNQFHSEVESFQSERSDLLRLLKFLHEAKLLPETVESDYPHLANLVQALSLDAASDQENLEVQIRKLAQDFKVKHAADLSREKKMEFEEKFQVYQTGRLPPAEFLKFLIQTGRSIGISPRLSPAIRAMISQSKTLSAIKGTKLFDELNLLLDKIENKLIRSEKEREIAEEYKKLHLLQNLATLEVGRDELDRYQSDPENYLALLGDAALDIYPALQFYQIVLERDEAFHRNLASLIQSRKAQAVIVLAGGFHSRGFEQSLKDKGYSYAVVMPKMNSLEGHKAYEEVMQGNLSYKKYLQTSFYDAFAKHSSEALFQEMNEPDFRRNLKFWRDEIIRNLSREGRIAETGCYTRYVDRLTQNYFEKYGSEKTTKDQIIRAVEKVLDEFRKNTVNALAQQLRLPLGRTSTMSQFPARLIFMQRFELRDINPAIQRFFSSGEKPSLVPGALTPLATSSRPVYIEALSKIANQRKPLVPSDRARKMADEIRQVTQSSELSPATLDAGQVMSNLKRIFRERGISEDRQPDFAAEVLAALNVSASDAFQRSSPRQPGTLETLQKGQKTYKRTKSNHSSRSEMRSATNIAEPSEHLGGRNPMISTQETGSKLDVPNLAGGSEMRGGIQDDIRILLEGRDGRPGLIKPWEHFGVVSNNAEAIADQFDRAVTGSTPSSWTIEKVVVDAAAGEYDWVQEVLSQFPDVRVAYVHLRGSDLFENLSERARYENEIRRSSPREIIEIKYADGERYSEKSLPKGMIKVEFAPHPQPLVLAETRPLGKSVITIKGIPEQDIYGPLLERRIYPDFLSRSELRTEDIRVFRPKKMPFQDIQNGRFSFTEADARALDPFPGIVRTIIVDSVPTQNASYKPHSLTFLDKRGKAVFYLTLKIDQADDTVLIMDSGGPTNYLREELMTDQRDRHDAQRIWFNQSLNDWAFPKGFKKIRVAMDPRNTGSQKFFREMSFVNDPVHPDQMIFYFHPPASVRSEMRSFQYFFNQSKLLAALGSTLLLPIVSAQGELRVGIGPGQVPGTVNVYVTEGAGNTVHEVLESPSVNGVFHPVAIVKTDEDGNAAYTDQLSGGIRFYRARALPNEGAALFRFDLPAMEFSAGVDRAANYQIDLGQASGVLFEDGKAAGTFSRFFFPSRVSQADGYFTAELQGEAGSQEKIIVFGLFSKLEGVLHAEFIRYGGTDIFTPDPTKRIVSVQDVMNFLASNIKIASVSSLRSRISSFVEGAQGDSLPAQKMMEALHPEKILVRALGNWKSMSQDDIYYRLNHMPYLGSNDPLILETATHFQEMLASRDGVITDEMKGQIYFDLIPLIKYSSNPAVSRFVTSLILQGFDFFLKNSQTDLDYYLVDLAKISRNENLDSESIQLLVEKLKPWFNAEGISLANSVEARLVSLSFFLHPSLTLENNQEIIRTAFDFIRDSRFFTGPMTGLNREYLTKVAEIFLDQAHLKKLPDDSPLRSRVIDAWSELIRTQPDLLGKLDALSVQDFGWSKSGAFIRERFEAIGLMAARSQDIERVVEVLGLQGDRAEIFREHQILVLDTTDSPFSEAQLTNIRSWLSNYPESMLDHLGIIIKVARGEHSDFGGRAVNISDYFFNTVLVDVSKGTLDHELWHAFAGVIQRENFLPGKKWIRDKLSQEFGTPEDNASWYGSIQPAENDADFGKYLMQDTLGQLDKWLAMAVQSDRFIGLRHVLSLMEILVHNSGGSQLPVYKAGPPGYAPVSTDANKNITMIELAERGMRYHVSYTPDNLLIESVTIETIGTGEKVTYENAQAIEHEMTLTKDIVISEETDGAGKIKTFADAAGRTMMVEHFDPAGLLTEKDIYNLNGSVIRKRYFDASQNNDRTEHFDMTGRLTFSESFNLFHQRTTKEYFDADGRLIQTDTFNPFDQLLLRSDFSTAEGIYVVDWPGRTAVFTSQDGTTVKKWNLVFKTAKPPDGFELIIQNIWGLPARSEMRNEIMTDFLESVGKVQGALEKRIERLVRRRLDQFVSNYARPEFIAEPSGSRSGERYNIFSEPEEIAGLLIDRNTFWGDDPKPSIMKRLKAKIAKLNPSFMKKVRHTAIRELRRKGIQIHDRDILAIGSFGSYWYREEEADSASDIDLMVVVKPKSIQEQLTKIQIDPSQWFARGRNSQITSADILVVSEEYYLDHKAMSRSGHASARQDAQTQLYMEANLWASLIPLQGFDYWAHEPHPYNLANALRQKILEAKEQLSEGNSYKLRRRWNEARNLWNRLVSGRYLDLNPEGDARTDFEKLDEEMQEIFARDLVDFRSTQVEYNLLSVLSLTTSSEVVDRLKTLLERHVAEHSKYYFSTKPADNNYDPVYRRIMEKINARATMKKSTRSELRNDLPIIRQGGYAALMAALPKELRGGEPSIIIQKYPIPDLDGADRVIQAALKAKDDLPARIGSPEGLSPKERAISVFEQLYQQYGINRTMLQKSAYRGVEMSGLNLLANEFGNQGKRFTDLGSGDGRTVARFALESFAARGIEFEWSLFVRSIQLVNHLVDLFRGDAALPQFSAEPLLLERDAQGKVRKAVMRWMREDGAGSIELIYSDYEKDPAIQFFEDDIVYSWGAFADTHPGLLAKLSTGLKPTARFVDHFDYLNSRLNPDFKDHFEIDRLIREPGQETSLPAFYVFKPRQRSELRSEKEFSPEVRSSPAGMMNKMKFLTTLSAALLLPFTPKLAGQTSPPITVSGNQPVNPEAVLSLVRETVSADFPGIPGEWVSVFSTTPLKDQKVWTPEGLPLPGDFVWTNLVEVQFLDISPHPNSKLLRPYPRYALGRHKDTGALRLVLVSPLNVVLDNAVSYLIERAYEMELENFDNKGKSVRYFKVANAVAARLSQIAKVWGVSGLWFTHSLLTRDFILSTGESIPPDIRRFNLLNPSIREEFIQVALADPKLYWKFLTFVFRQGTLTDSEREAVRNVLETTLASRIAGYGPEHGVEALSEIIEISKVIEQKDKVEPLLLSFMHPYQDSPGSSIPEESEAAFNDRKNLFLAIWRNHGIFIKDEILNYFARDLRILRNYYGYLGAAGKFMGPGHHLLNIDPEYPGAGATWGRGIIHLNPLTSSSSIDDKMAIQHHRVWFLQIMLHELGHNAHYWNFPVQFDAEWKRLHQMSPPEDQVEDLAFGKYGERIADEIALWFEDGRKYLEQELERAVRLGKTRRLQKLLLLANLLSEIAPERNPFFDLYRMDVSDWGPENRNIVAFYSNGLVQILDRNSDGHITKITVNGTKEYTFHYEGWQLKSVEAHGETDRLVIQKIRWDPQAGGVHLTVNFSEAGEYILESTEDFKVWNQVGPGGILILEPGSIELTLPFTLPAHAPKEKQFYRVRKISDLPAARSELRSGKKSKEERQKARLDQRRAGDRPQKTSLFTRKEFIGTAALALTALGYGVYSVFESKTLPLYIAYGTHQYEHYKDVRQFFSEAVSHGPRLADGRPDVIYLMEHTWSKTPERILAVLQGRDPDAAENTSLSLDEIRQMLERYRSDQDFKRRVDAAYRQGMAKYGDERIFSIAAYLRSNPFAAKPSIQIFVAGLLKDLQNLGVREMLYEKGNFEIESLHAILERISSNRLKALEDGDGMAALRWHENYITMQDEMLGKRDEIIGEQIRSLKIPKRRPMILHYRGLGHQKNVSKTIGSGKAKGIRESSSVFLKFYDLASMRAMNPVERRAFLIESMVERVYGPIVDLVDPASAEKFFSAFHRDVEKAGAQGANSEEKSKSLDGWLNTLLEDIRRRSRNDRSQFPIASFRIFLQRGYIDQKFYDEFVRKGRSGLLAQFLNPPAEPPPLLASARSEIRQESISRRKFLKTAGASLLTIPAVVRGLGAEPPQGKPAVTSKLLMEESQWNNLLRIRPVLDHVVSVVDTDEGIARRNQWAAVDPKKASAERENTVGFITRVIFVESEFKNLAPRTSVKPSLDRGFFQLKPWPTLDMLIHRMDDADQKRNTRQWLENFYEKDSVDKLIRVLENLHEQFETKPRRKQLKFLFQVLNDPNSSINQVRLKYREGIAEQYGLKAAVPARNFGHLLDQDIVFGALMLRLHVLKVTSWNWEGKTYHGTIPVAPVWQARYWKVNYNTDSGSGTVEAFLEKSKLLDHDLRFLPASSRSEMRSKYKPEPVEGGDDHGFEVVHARTLNEAHDLNDLIKQVEKNHDINKEKLTPQQYGEIVNREHALTGQFELLITMAKDNADHTIKLGTLAQIIGLISYRVKEMDVWMMDDPGLGPLAPPDIPRSEMRSDSGNRLKFLGNVVDNHLRPMLFSMLRYGDFRRDAALFFLRILVDPSVPKMERGEIDADFQDPQTKRTPEEVKLFFDQLLPTLASFDVSRQKGHERISRFHILGIPFYIARDPETGYWYNEARPREDFFRLIYSHWYLHSPTPYFFGWPDAPSFPRKKREEAVKQRILEIQTAKKKYFPDAQWMSFADIGSGVQGEELGKAAQKAGWTDVTMVEPYLMTESVERKIQEAGIRSYRSFDQLIQEGRQFDTVTSLTVLEHVPDPKVFLKQLARIAKEGGMLYLRIPNTPASGPLAETVLEHLNHFTPQTIRVFLEEAGFEYLDATASPSTRDARPAVESIGIIARRSEMRGGERDRPAAQQLGLDLTDKGLEAEERSAAIELGITDGLDGREISGENIVDWLRRVVRQGAYFETHPDYPFKAYENHGAKSSEDVEAIKKYILDYAAKIGEKEKVKTQLTDLERRANERGRTLKDALIARRGLLLWAAHGEDELARIEQLFGIKDVSSVTLKDLPWIPVYGGGVTVARDLIRWFGRPEAVPPKAYYQSRLDKISITELARRGLYRSEVRSAADDESEGESEDISEDPLSSELSQNLLPIPAALRNAGLLSVKTNEAGSVVTSLTVKGKAVEVPLYSGTPLSVERHDVLRRQEMKHMADSLSETMEAADRMDASREKKPPASEALTLANQSAAIMKAHSESSMEEIRKLMGLDVKRDELKKKLVEQVSFEQGFTMFRKAVKQLYGRNIASMQELNSILPHITTYDVMMVSTLQRVPENMLLAPLLKNEYLRTYDRDLSGYPPMIFEIDRQGVHVTIDTIGDDEFSRNRSVESSAGAAEYVGVTGGYSKMEFVPFRTDFARAFQMLLLLQVEDSKIYRRLIEQEAGNTMMIGHGKFRQSVLQNLSRYNPDWPEVKALQELLARYHITEADLQLPLNELVRKTLMPPGLVNPALDKILAKLLANKQIKDLSRNLILTHNTLDLFTVAGLLAEIPASWLGEEPMAAYLLNYGKGFKIFDADGELVDYVSFSSWVQTDAQVEFREEVAADIRLTNSTAAEVFEEFTGAVAKKIDHEDIEKSEIERILDALFGNYRIQLFNRVAKQFVPERMFLRENPNRRTAKHTLKMGLDEVRVIRDQIDRIGRALPQLLQGIKRIEKRANFLLDYQAIYEGWEAHAQYSPDGTITIFESTTKPFFQFRRLDQQLYRDAVIHEIAHPVWNHLPQSVKKKYQAISWKKRIPISQFAGHFLTRYGGTKNLEEDFAEHFMAYVNHGPEFKRAAARHKPLAEKYRFFNEQVFRVQNASGQWISVEYNETAGITLASMEQNLRAQVARQTDKEVSEVIVQGERVKAKAVGKQLKGEVLSVEAEDRKIEKEAASEEDEVSWDSFRPADDDELEEQDEYESDSMHPDEAEEEEEASVSEELSQKEGLYPENQAIYDAMTSYGVSLTALRRMDFPHILDLVRSGSVDGLKKYLGEFGLEVENVEDLMAELKENLSQTNEDQADVLKKRNMSLTESAEYASEAFHKISRQSMPIRIDILPESRAYGVALGEFHDNEKEKAIADAIHPFGEILRKAKVNRILITEVRIPNRSFLLFFDTLAWIDDARATSFYEGKKIDLGTGLYTQLKKGMIRVFRTEARSELRVSQPALDSREVRRRSKKPTRTASSTVMSRDSRFPSLESTLTRQSDKPFTSSATSIKLRSKRSTKVPTSDAVKDFSSDINASKNQNESGGSVPINKGAVNINNRKYEYAYNSNIRDWLPAKILHILFSHKGINNFYGYLAYFGPSAKSIDAALVLAAANELKKLSSELAAANQKIMWELEGLESVEQILGWVNSPALDEAIQKNLGDLADVVNAATLAGIIRSAVKGEILGDKVGVQPSAVLKLTSEAKAMLEALSKLTLHERLAVWHRGMAELLNQGNDARTDFVRPLIFDLDQADESEMDSYAAFIGELVQAGNPVGFVFEQANPKHDQMIKRLRKEFGSKLEFVGHRSGEPADFKKFSRVSFPDYFAILEAGTGVENVPAQSADDLIYARSSLAKHTELGGVKGFLELALLVLASPYLRKFLEPRGNGQGMNMTEQAFNRIIGFINELAETRAVQQAVSQAA